MATEDVVDGLCRYLGGPYDPVRHIYYGPTLFVAGLAMGAVRRARPKRLDAADYYLGASGALVGCQILVVIPTGEESREGFGGPLYGLKRVRHDVTVDCMLRSTSPYAEDVQDAAYRLRSAITARIHADRTCGSGGFEAGGFLVGEIPPWITWFLSDVVSVAERSEALLRADFPAVEYVQA